MRLVSIVAMTVISGAMSSAAFAAAGDGLAEGASCLVGTALARAEAFSSPLGGAGDDGEAPAVAQAEPAHSPTQAAAPPTTTASSAGGECLRGVRMDAALSAATALAGDLNDMPMAGEEGPGAQAVQTAVREAPAAPVAVKPKKVIATPSSVATAAPVVARKKTATASAAKAAKISEAFKPWWPKAAEGKLNLAYAGPAAFDSAIVLLFDRSFETAELSNAQIKVIDNSGKQVKSQWVVASGNKKMLTAKVPEGRYLVKVGPKLASMDGSTVVGEFGGPVLVGLK